MTGIAGLQGLYTAVNSLIGELVKANHRDQATALSVAMSASVFEEEILKALLTPLGHIADSNTADTHMRSEATASIAFIRHELQATPA